LLLQRENHPGFKFSLYRYIAEWLLDVVTPGASALSSAADEEEAEEQGRDADDELWRAYEKETAPLIRRRVDAVNAQPGLSPHQILSRRHNPIAARPERRRVTGFWRQLCVLGGEMY
jgi:hypothetical protein